jgi:hypothetical protein
MIKKIIFSTILIATALLSFNVYSNAGDKNALNNKTQINYLEYNILKDKVRFVFNKKSIPNTTITLQFGDGTITKVKLDSDSNADKNLVFPENKKPLFLSVDINGKIYNIEKPLTILPEQNKNNENKNKETEQKQDLNTQIKDNKKEQSKNIKQEDKKISKKDKVLPNTKAYK